MTMLFIMGILLVFTALVSRLLRSATQHRAPAWHGRSS